MKVNNEDILEIDNTRSEPSMGASFNLKPIYLGHINSFSIQMVFTGTPVGNFKLQVSNDAGRPAANTESGQYVAVTNWTDVAGSTQSISEAGDHTYAVSNAGYLWIRVVYTRVSGTGTLITARINEKGI